MYFGHNRLDNECHWDMVRNMVIEANLYYLGLMQSGGRTVCLGDYVRPNTPYFPLNCVTPNIICSFII